MTTLLSRTFGDPNDTGVDMPNWDLTPLQTGEITTASGDSVTIRAGDQTFTLTGHDFSYIVENGEVHLAAGTITGLTSYPYPPPPTASIVPVYNYAISDFHLDVGAFNAFVDGNDVAGYERALFSGDDHLEGGVKKDYLTGLRGNDHIDGAYGDDGLYGGRGNDVLIGGAGADWLSGGRGADVFVYHGASESGGGVYDGIERFNTQDDLLLVPSAVTGIDRPVDAGTSDSFNVDPNLSAALDAGHLGANHAVIATVAVDIGPPDTAGTGDPPIILETFLVVDLNGVAGYQAGEDLAIRIAQPNGLDHLSVDDFLSTG